MPPTGSLRSDLIDTIKTWIDQGAEWPDALANEADVLPLNPKAVAMIEALRAGDRRSFMKFVEDPKLLNARGQEGSTPFMYAVLYSDVVTLQQLLKKGADPNAHNDAKATALMWAATDLEKTRVLLAHNAQVNARSDDLRTPFDQQLDFKANASYVEQKRDLLHQGFFFGGARLIRSSARTSFWDWMRSGIAPISILMPSPCFCARIKCWADAGGSARICGHRYVPTATLRKP